MPAAIPGQIVASFRRIRALIVKEKNFPEARKALAGIPDGELYAQYHIAMAAIAMAENDNDIAMAHFEQALAITPDDLRLVAGVGKLRLQEGNNALAREYAERALRLKVSKKAEANAIVSLLQELGDSENAERILSEFLVENPNDSKLRRMLAINQLQAGKLDECERSLNNCLRLDPKNHYSQILMGELLVSKGEKVRGLAILRAADNETCPEKLKDRLLMDTAECYMALDEYSNARDELNRIESSENPRFNYCWGKVHFEAKDYDFALTSLLAAKNAITEQGVEKQNVVASETKEIELQNKCEEIIDELKGKFESINKITPGSPKMQYQNIWSEETGPEF